MKKKKKKTRIKVIRRRFGIVSPQVKSCVYDNFVYDGLSFSL